MTTENSRFSVAVYLLMALVGLLLLGLVAYIEQKGTESIWLQLVREIGLALIVAVILIFSIERLTRERHIQEVNKWIGEVSNSVFKAVIARNTPRSVYLEVEKNLLYRDFFRKDTSVTYTLRKFEAADQDIADNQRSEFRKCDVHFHYIVENVNQADRVINYPLTLVFNIPLQENLRSLCKITAVSVDGSPIVVELGKNLRIGEQDMAFRHDLHISRGQSVLIRCAWTQVQKAEGEEVWSSTDPTEGVTFTVNTPDGDLKVWGDSMHSEKLDVISESKYAVTWRLPHGIFPYQGIYFRWLKG